MKSMAYFWDLGIFDPHLSSCLMVLCSLCPLGTLLEPDPDPSYPSLWVGIPLQPLPRILSLDCWGLCEDRLESIERLNHVGIRGEQFRLPPKDNQKYERWETLGICQSHVALRHAS